MSFRSSGKLVAALVALLAVAVLASAQQSQRRTSRRVTNPLPHRPAGPAPTPLPAEPSVVRTAEDVAAQEEPEVQPRRRQATARTRRSAGRYEQEDLRDTVDKLSQTVTRLSEDLTEMRGEQRTLVELERLTRAEQRAETMRAQLRDVTDKEFMLQDRLAQIDVELQPDSIERRAALVGTLNPSAVREQIRLSLQRERERIQRQLELLAASRTRLESAVADADLEVERLKARVDAAEQRQGDANAQAAQPAATPTPAEDQMPEPPEE